MENELKKIIIVDDNVTNLTAARNLLRASYDVYPALSAESFFDMIERVFPDLILLDIEMPEMDGYETLKRLKADKRYKDIPVIFLTARGDEGSELQGLSLGAVDYISKPFSPALLLKRVENHLLILSQREEIRKHASNLGTLVNKKMQEVFKLQNAILHTVADLVEFRDSFTGGHTTNSQQYMEIMINGLIENGVYSSITINWNMDFILPSVQLHDVGKIAISDTILNKPPESLSVNELDTLKSHVTIGMDAVRRIMSNTPNHAFLHHALNIIGTHHENWDGSGYPMMLEGERIPLEGRLMALVDTYDMMISWRPYKKAFSHEETVQFIKEGSAALFDPVLVDVFLELAAKFKQVNREVRLI